MSEFVPASAKDLFDRMCVWTDLRGTISYDETKQSMTWILAVDLRLDIAIFDIEGRIEVFDSPEARHMSLTHWHPEAEEIYEQMLKINAGRIRFPYINSLFGKIILEVGEEYPKRKHRFRAVHYLGEENE